MNKYKVCVYAICKNEEKFVDRWMDSMSEADMIVVTDTGSTDNTVERLRSRGAIVFEEKIEPWRFDVARNISLSHVPEDADICVCTDLDEVFNKGWRQALERGWRQEAHIAQYIYNWRLKPNGEPDVQFRYFKIHTRHNIVWKCPVHEFLTYTGGAEKRIFIEGIVLNHYPDPNKSRGSYLGLLETAVREDPRSDRMSYYLGREYSYVRQWHKCIAELKRYLSLPSATWDEERGAAARILAAAYFNLKDYKNCYKWHYQSVFEAPNMREPYVEFAISAYKLKDWPTVLCMASQAEKIKEKSPTYVNMSWAWDYTIYDLKALACYYLGMLDASLVYAEQALKMDPQNERLRNNVNLIRQAKNG